MYSGSTFGCWYGCGGCGCGGFGRGCGRGRSCSCFCFCLALAATPFANRQPLLPLVTLRCLAASHRSLGSHASVSYTRSHRDDDGWHPATIPTFDPVDHSRASTSLRSSQAAAARASATLRALAASSDDDDDDVDDVTEHVDDGADHRSRGNGVSRRHDDVSAAGDASGVLHRDRSLSPRRPREHHDGGSLPVSAPSPSLWSHSSSTTSGSPRMLQPRRDVRRNGGATAFQEPVSRLAGAGAADGDDGDAVKQLQSSAAHVAAITGRLRSLGLTSSNATPARPSPSRHGTSACNASP